MHVERVTDIDEGDIIAFIDDLPFEYEGVHEIHEAEESAIDWVKVTKAQITGTIVILHVTHQNTQFQTGYRVADFVKVIVDD